MLKVFKELTCGNKSALVLPEPSRELQSQVLQKISPVISNGTSVVTKRKMGDELFNDWVGEKASFGMS